jgi:hypothetical protein
MMALQYAEQVTAPPPPSLPSFVPALLVDELPQAATAKAAAAAADAIFKAPKKVLLATDFSYSHEGAQHRPSADGARTVDGDGRLQ